MEIFSIPPTIFIAFGVISAALLAGFFSFLNLISTKENKVSEFRLSWVDGLRDEIASYTAAILDLVRAEENYMELDRDQYSYKEIATIDQKYLTDTRKSYIAAIENLSKIQLRLNPEHVKDTKSHEAILMMHINNARKCFNDSDYTGAANRCGDIRSAAAPLLKSTWDLVKGGENEYKKIRATAQKIIKYGIGILIISALLLGAASFIASNNKNTDTIHSQTTGQAISATPQEHAQTIPKQIINDIKSFKTN
ncbi:hypothetical protein K5D43_01065 [Pseudomonas cichorii]|nr:hypothetical protein [Pseudomonas cichorii]MBX8553055.1 hypothetical protein [Pseudomonas cichorii]